VRTFIDTNILVYAADPAEATKRLVAQRTLDPLFLHAEAVFSTQVLQEYYSTLIRKLRLPVDVARGQVENLARLDVVLIDPEMILAAIDLHRLRRIQFWDALIIRAAVAGGCARLLTEDLAHGETYEGVTVENPFR